MTGVAPGSVAITATSEGKAGTALVAIKYNITSVVMTGSGRIKVGDNYTYTATARLADGTVVNRPVSWNVKEAGKGTIGPTGVLTPLQTGTITLQAIIDGDVWESTFSAYDWQSFTSSGSQFASVEADIQITNKFGTSEYPQLVMSCSASGNFFVWISTTNFVTQNGFVAMSFDGGAAFSQTWDELSPNYRTLWKPGSNGTIKAFAQQIAATRLFGFAFTEFQGQAKATIFRVSGLSSRLAPMIALCPGNAIMATVEQLAKSEAMGSAMMSSSAISSPQLTALRASRALAPPSIGGTPLPQLDAPTASIPQLQQAVRVKR